MGKHEAPERSRPARKAAMREILHICHEVTIGAIAIFVMEMVKVDGMSVSHYFVEKVL